MLEWLPINIKVKGDFIDLWDGSTCNSSPQTVLRLRWLPAAAFPEGSLIALSGLFLLVFLLLQGLHGWKESFALLSLNFQGSRALRALTAASGESVKPPSLEAFKNRPDKFMSSKALIFLTLLESKRVDWRSFRNFLTSVYRICSHMARSLKNYFSACGLHNTWTCCMNLWQKQLNWEMKMHFHVLSPSKMGRKKINEAQRFGLISVPLYMKIVTELSYFCFVKKKKLVIFHLKRETVS